MSDPRRRQTISFVVRLWVEQPTQSARPARWRGQIEHVESGEQTHFQVPEALIEFLTKHVSILPRTRPT